MPSGEESDTPQAGAAFPQNHSIFCKGNIPDRPLESPPQNHTICRKEKKPDRSSERHAKNGPQDLTAENIPDRAPERRVRNG